MEYRICKKCTRELPESCFYRDTRYKDEIRFRPTCKDCINKKSKVYRDDDPEREAERHRKYRQDNIETCKAYAAKYRSEHPSEIKVYGKQYREDNAETIAVKLREFRLRNTERYAAYAKKARDKFPEKAKARSKVSDAIKSGKLIPGVCAVCGATDRIQAHHSDYTKPLDVTWLCIKCHHALHKRA